MKLVDIVPNVMVPTWSTGQCDGAGLPKQLDKFLLDENLCDDFGKYRSWSYSMGISNHKAIILLIDFDKKIVKFPFKFNSIWLEETYFCEFVKKQWINMSKVSYSSVMFGLISKLSKHKVQVQKWEKIKKKDENQKDLRK